MDNYGFEARLRHLEHVLIGQQNMQLSKTAKDNLLKRVNNIHKELDTVYKNNKPIKSFIEKCKNIPSEVNVWTFFCVLWLISN